MEKQKDINKTTELKIIEVATELFGVKGYEGTSIRDICKKANVNISLVSYYFGGKKELYEKVVASIAENIITYMKKGLEFETFPPNFEKCTRDEKIKILFFIFSKMFDYFYSGNVSDAAILIIFREQITSGIPINTTGYNVLRRLIASILDKNENDKEVIFKTITIVGQVHAPRILKQFSLGMMHQSGYSNADIQMLKQIIMGQIKSILLEG